MANEVMARVADRQLNAVAPIIEKIADTYCDLVEDGWNSYFRLRYRQGLLAYDVQQLIETSGESLSGIEKYHDPYMPELGGKSLETLVRQHQGDKSALMSLAGAFLLETLRRGGGK